jgi:crossover junction endodeoxyribonuclease RuvC
MDSLFILRFDAPWEALTLSIILGLDPGSRITGFGVLKVSSKTIEVVSYGIIKLDAEASFPLRMQELSESVEQLLGKYQPQAVSLEKIFLGKNADSAFKLGHARGILMCESAKFGATVHEYATRVVKKSVTGKGSATKEDVQLMVQRTLRLPAIQQVDASDALAMALHHAYLVMSGDRMQNFLRKNIKDLNL